MRSTSRTVAGVLVFMLAHSALGGSLGDRSKDVAERSEKKKADDQNKPSSGGSHKESRSSFGSGTYPSSSSSGFLSDFWSWMILAPFAYRPDDPSASMDPDEGGWVEVSDSIFPRHKTGQATIPYVRIDYNRLWAEQVDAHDGRFEAGYKLVAVHGRLTRYEDEVGEKLDIRQYYLALRYGGYRPGFVPGTFEFAVGLGLVHHTGSALSNNGLDEDTSGALTIPIKYYPADWLGFEFRPSWYRFYDIAHGDYDLSVSAGMRYLQVRGGYRWIWENGRGIVDALSGPYAGLSVSF